MKYDRKEKLELPLPALNSRVLIVDLHKQEWEEKAIPMDVFERYLYGRGICAYLLSSVIDLDLYHGKPLVFAPGLLTGIIPFSRNCLSVVEDNKRLAVYSFTGQWGLELKNAGFAGLVITGNSSIPVVLHIRNGAVSFDDYPGTWDLKAAEIAAMIKSEYGNQWMEVMVMTDPGFPFSPLIARSFDSTLQNTDQLFESKQLRAISVRGTRGFGISNPELLKIELSKLTSLFSRVMIENDCKGIKPGLGDPKIVENAHNYDESALLPLSWENSMIIEDCLGLDQIIDYQILLKLMNSVTGLDYSYYQLNSTAERIKTAEVLR